MEFINLLPNSELPLDLLLDADPSLEQINKYIYDCTILGLKQDANIIGILCIKPLSTHTVEIKNIAIASTYQNKGLGKKLMQHALSLLKNSNIKKVIIKTANSSIHALAFYQKMGFRIRQVNSNYFLTHYPDQQIIENGIPCLDQIQLEYLLDKK